LKIAILVAAAVGFLALPAAMAEEVFIKFSHVTNSQQPPKYLAAEEFAKHVNERMKGKVRVEVYPGGQLFNDTAVLIEHAAQDHHRIHKVLAKHSEREPWTDRQHRLPEEALCLARDFGEVQPTLAEAPAHLVGAVHVLTDLRFKALECLAIPGLELLAALAAHSRTMSAVTSG